MGAFYVTVGVRHADTDEFEDLQALVDTGAMWTWIPRDILERLGHRPTVVRRLQTVDNRIIVRDAGGVPLKVGSEVLSSLCIYGDAGSHVLLGATKMQEFSVGSDPVNERLVPVLGLADVAVRMSRRSSSATLVRLRRTIANRGLELSRG
jgi:aspartyl protease family protein